MPWVPASGLVNPCFALGYAMTCDLIPAAFISFLNASTCAFGPDGALYVSMPAFGIGNAWSDTRAYGGTLEQATGLPLYTCHADGPPAMTSSPNYQDAGPPVVAGPSPTAGPGLSPSPTPTTTSGEPFVRMRPAPSSAARSAVSGGAPDLGPPVAAGPGPHYDYSTPNAAGR